MVGRVVEAPRAALLSGIDPFIADDGEERVAFPDHILDALGKIHPERDIFHVEENVALAEVRNEAIPNAAGHVGAVASSIRNEDAAFCGAR